MGRDRKRFNVKGRQQQKKVKGGGAEDGDKNQVVSVAVDHDIFTGEKFDESNPLLLPSKRKEKDRSGGRFVAEKGKKFLSKKQRKKLEAIVDRREKKSGRAELLQELQKHQLTPQTFATLTPLVKVQTEGLKKLFAQREKDKQNEKVEESSVGVGQAEKKKAGQRSSIKGGNQLKFRSWSGRFSNGGEKSDPKVLGFEEQEESSSSSSEEEEMEQDDEILVKKEESEDDEESESEEVAEIDVEPEKPEKRKKPEKNPEVEVVAAVRVAKTFVPVHRTKEIEAVRSKLPIIPEEQVIMEAITHNAVTVLAGETGSGKTTQVPQFLYEAGYALNGKIIGVTEPRRVAAIAMSMRVAKELNLSTQQVSYQIRFDGNVSSKTEIKFMTDGVLLKEMERDFLLSKYSAICIDEAHERSLYTDLLIGLLSRCVTLRSKRQDPLKLIIMSATMRVEDFVENPVLFKSPPPLIHVPTRQFPVQVHFAKHTPDNYVVAAYRKAIQIHRKLPPGGILVFLTGQQEVRTVVKQLQKLFPSQADQEKDKTPEGKLPLRKKKNGKTSGTTRNLRTFDLDKLQKMPLKCEDDEEENSDQEEDEEMEEWGVDDEDDEEAKGNREPLHVLPLYTMLPSKEQQKVFETPPAGSRLCVVATNVAETSLTIPSVRYVVDCGKVKLKMWDKLTGVEQFSICWESKASAEQRAGRAGRTGPGHCYRLFSSALFSSDFDAYSQPEIQVRPVDDMMLLMKSMGIDRVQHFPYPSPPARNQLVAAEKTLIALGALEDKKRGEDNTVITELGKTMAFFPLGPRFSKMVALSFHHSLVEYTIALVSALTVQEVFLDTVMHESSKSEKSHWAALRRKWAGTGTSFLLGDCMVLLRAVGAFEYGGGTPEFCLKTGLRYKAMLEIRKLRKQLTSEVNLLVSAGQEVPLNPHMEPPTEQQSILLRQIILSGLPDRIARKILDSELKEGEDPKVYKHAYRCGELDDPVFIHSSSSLRTASPQWIVYQQVFESQGKMYLRGVTAIEPEWICTFCESLCKMEPPLKDPPPFYNQDKETVYCSVKATYGKQGWELPTVLTEYPLILDKFKYFSQFLLEGQVFPKLQKWRPNLLSMPVTMTKSWAKLQPRTQTLLTALTSSGIHSRRELLEKWEKEGEFLLKEYLQWIPEDLRSQVTLNWPPLE